MKTTIALAAVYACCAIAFMVYAYRMPSMLPTFVMVWFVSMCDVVIVAFRHVRSGGGVKASDAAAVAAFLAVPLVISRHPILPVAVAVVAAGTFFTAWQKYAPAAIKRHAPP